MCEISGLVLYDITSTYFEGAGPHDFARHGYSRDGKPQNVQVIVGVVMVAGWPIAHHVWAGNRIDHSTVQEVIRDLHRRFGFARLVFVGDRGMVTDENIAALTREGHGFLVGVKRRAIPGSRLTVIAISTGSSRPGCWSIPRARRRLGREKKIEGKYVVMTEREGLSILDAVAQYKELTEVESGFRQLKDVDIRPIYHQIECESRLIFLLALALLVQRLLGRRLQAAGVDLSPARAMQALTTVRLVTFHLEGQPERRGLTGGCPDARLVLKALKLADERPPVPPVGEETVM